MDERRGNVELVVDVNDFIRKEVGESQAGGWSASMEGVGSEKMQKAQTDRNEFLAEKMDRLKNIRDDGESGNKFDDSKTDLTLVPPELTEAVARVMMFGVQKYSRGGWRSVPDARRRYFAALLRHLHRYQAGEDNDAETGMPHLWHAATNIGFLIAYGDGIKPDLGCGGRFNE